jgi:segregation and condensation protein B
MELLKQQVQALIFCSEQSISIDEIASSLKLSFDWDISEEEILAAIDEIRQQFAADEFSFELAEISDGYQFLTKKQYFPAISALIQHKAKKKLSVSQMETLAIIAYRQPISKAEVEHIRGVSCDYAVQKLLEKELIEISGKSDGPGRPVLYSTSRSFMDYFGIKTVKDLPQLKDLHVEENEIGTPADVLGDHDEIIETSPVETVSETMTASDNQNVSGGTEEEVEFERDVVIENSEIQEENEPLEDWSDDFPAEEIPDRRSIYLENELKNEIPEEEKGDHIE